MQAAEITVSAKRKIMHEGESNMKDYMKIYQEWLANPYFDEKTKEELRAIANDENEIKERFYRTWSLVPQDFAESSGRGSTV